MKLMPLFNQKGIASVFSIFILLVGLIAGVYLVKQQNIFKSRAYESGEVNFINDFKQPFTNNATSNIFVHLEIKPPAWQEEVKDPENYEYPSLLRISFDPTKLNPENDCEITGNPETNCQEIILNKPTDKTYLSWVLPNTNGEHKINVRVFSNRKNTKDLSVTIKYKDGEAGFEVPAFLIGIQSLINSVFDIFRKLPVTSAINATALFITHVYTAGEQVITLSQAQQLGFYVNFSVSEDGEIEFLYDEEQLKKLNIAMEFFKETDSITEEPRLVMLPKANPTDLEDTLQATLETALGETGGRIAGSLINKGITKITEGKSLKVLKSKVKLSENSAAAGTGGRVVSRGIGRVPGLAVRNLARMAPFESNVYRTLLPYLQTGEAYPLNPAISGPVMEKLLAGVESVYGSQLPKLNKDAIRRTVWDNWVIVLPYDRMLKLFPDTPYGFARERLVILADFNVQEHILAHEFVHVISANTRALSEKMLIPTGDYFRYSQDQADIYGATMSQIYELFTDEVIRVFFHTPADYGYKYKFPELYQSLTGFVNNLIRTTGGKISYRDFSALALSGSDKRLMKTLIDNGIKPADLMYMLNKNVPGARLAQIMKDYYRTRNNKIFRAGIVGGGGAVFLGTFFAATVKGEELPPDTTIIYDNPLDHDIDNHDIDTENTKTETTSNSPNPPKCPSSYPQCGGTVGLENMIKGHAYLVTPVCDASGNIKDYRKDDQGKSAACGGNPSPATTTPPPAPFSCKPPYPQCGGTVGLEDFPTSHTILVTPVCDNAGNITDYKKGDLGDRGECL